MSFRDELFAQPAERTIESVETPAGKTFVRSLMAGEKDKFDRAAHQRGRFRARLIVACCCDEGGNPIFNEADIPRLDDMPVPLIEPIVDAAIRVNRMSPEDAEAIRKN